MFRTREVFSGLTPKVREVVYHYCGPDGLLGILRSRAIWATSMIHLNDTSERTFAAELIRSVALRLAGKDSAESQPPEGLPALLLIERAESAISYVACFSEHDDLLSQWRAYAPPTGRFRNRSRYCSPSFIWR